MKLLKSNIPPLIFGTWVLRVTNDINIENGLNYIIINDEPVIKLKTIKKEGLFGIKKSRTVLIENIKQISKNTYNFTLNYAIKNIYSYSLLGIEIPEIKSNSMSYNKIKDLSINIFDKTLLITDKDFCYYYIFDLNVGKIRYPDIETNINTFLFTQFISILLSVLITKFL